MAGCCGGVIVLDGTTRRRKSASRAADCLTCQRNRLSLKHVPLPLPRAGAEPMHRELSHADAVFGRPRQLGLYLFTALLGVLLVLDLLPVVADWLAGWGVSPPWGREVFGLRFALIAAVLG